MKGHKNLVNDFQARYSEFDTQVTFSLHLRAADV